MVFKDRFLSFLSAVLVFTLLILPSNCFAKDDGFVGNVEVTSFAYQALEAQGEDFELNRRYPNSGASALQGLAIQPSMKIPVLDGDEIREITVNFSPHSIYKKGYFQQTGNAAYHFKGVPEGGEEGDFARISIYRNDQNRPQMRGLIHVNDGYFVVTNTDGDSSAFFGASSAAASSAAAAAGNISLIVSNTDNDEVRDALKNCGAMSADGALVGAAGHNHDHDGNSVEAAIGGAEIGGAGQKEMEVRIDHDSQFYSIHGGGTVGESTSLFNSVDGIYQSELNLTIKISEQHVWTNSSDPYKDNLDPNDWGDILYDFRDNNQLAQTDHKHLFSGRTPPGNIIGVAWLNGVCKSSINQGVTTNFGSTATRIVTLAHEVGHNLGASHTYERPANCPNTDDIMCWYVQNGATKFYSTSRNQIASYIAQSGSCLTDVGSGTTYTVSGRVLENSTGLSGVTVSLSGVGSTTSNNSGSFSFSNVEPGSYTLSGSKAGYTIQSRTVGVSSQNVTKDLAATPVSYEISGQISKSTGGNLGGVSVAITGGNPATTNNAGEYSFPGLSNGTYTVTPTKSGWAFTPPSRSVTISGSDQVANFTATEDVNPPTISTHPANLSTFTGINAKFTCAGSAASYQWQKNSGGSWSNVAGATSASITVSQVTTAMSGDKYRCQNSNAAGTATSNAATLTVSDPPTLSTNKTVVSTGESITLSISQAIPASHSVRWLRGSTQISTSSSTSISTTVNSTSNFTVEISLSGSTRKALTNSVSVSVAGSVGATLSPSQGTLSVGGSQTLTATASGGIAPYTYTFFKVQAGGDVQLQQGSSNSVSVTAAAADLGNNIRFYVVVSDRDNRTGQSSQANFNVVGDPVISAQPQSTTVQVGDTAVFTVTASTAGRKEFRWYVNGVEVPGSGNDTFRIRNATMQDNGKKVQVKVSDQNNDTSTMSNEATLTVQGSGKPPHIKKQPKSVTGNLNKKVTLKVQAWINIDKKKTKGLTYQWYKDDVMMEGERAKKNKLQLGQLIPDIEGKYYVIVTNPSGLSVQSGDAHVSLNGTANLTVKVRFRPKKTKAKPVGAVVRGTCLARGKPKKVWKALASTAQYQFKIDGQIVATQTGKKGRKYKHTLTATDDGKEFTCSVVADGQTYDSTTGLTLKVK